MSDPTVEEVRFAVVLNGGLGSAAWMGGAVLELHRLTRADDAYGPLLGLVGGQARVDVINGTSAGGVNAAALALAQVNRYSDLSTLRDLWIEHARLDRLLRTPAKGEPISLLQGDEYFLPKIEEALNRLVTRFSPVPADERPLELRITTTMLREVVMATTDGVGQQITHGLNGGVFRFRRDQEIDQFSDPHGEAVPELCRKLALAARSSASFPLAFEPTFVPADGTGVGADMSDHASWVSRGDERDRSQYVVDGGVLMTTPTADVLRAIENMPADGPTRRVVMLMYPNIAPQASTADQPGEPPGPTETFGAITRAQLSEHNRAVVAELERHNRTVLARRSGRDAVLRILRRRDGNAVNNLYALAKELYPHFADLRIRHESHFLALRGIRVRTLRAYVDDDGRSWSIDRLRSVIETAHRNWHARHGNLPYVPSSCPPNEQSESGWPWGIETAAQLTSAVIDVLSRFAWALPVGEDLYDIRMALTRVHEVRTRLRKMQEHRTWSHEEPVGPDGEAWPAQLQQDQEAMRGELGDVLRQGAMTLAAAIGVVARVPPGRGVQDQSDWETVLQLSDSDVDAALPDDFRWLSRLLALEIATTCLAENARSTQGIPVDYVQVNLQTDNPFARYSVRPQDKAGGYAAGGITGLLERSWRANDWIWGRLDTATQLCRIMLDPVRIRRAAELDRRLAATSPDMLAQRTVNKLVDDLFGGVPTNAQIQHLVQAAVEELTDTFSASPDSALPTASPAVAGLFIWRLHIQIIFEELPELRRAVRTDVADGAHTRSHAVQFIENYASLLDAIEHVSPALPLRPETTDLGLKALDAFDRAGIAREPGRTQSPSDQMIRATATAAATVVTAADGDRLGLGAVRPATRILRGLVLLPYWVVTSLTQGRHISRLLTQFGVLTGGLLVVLALLGVLPAWAQEPAATLGAAVLLTVFGYSAIRSGTVVHGLVLLSPVIPVAAHTISVLKPRTGTLTPALIGLIIVGGTAVVLLVLGSLHGERRTPAQRLVRAVHLLPARWRQWRPAIPGVLLGLAVVTLLVLAGTSGALSILDRDPLLLTVVVTAAVLLACVLAYVGARSLRVWQLLPDRGWTAVPSTDRAAATASWSVVYGVCYIVIAIGLSFQAAGTPFGSRWWIEAPVWARAAMGTAIVFTAILLLAVPWLAPLRARRAVQRFLTAEVATDGNMYRDITEALVERLEKHGLLLRSLVQVQHGRRVTLTRAGHRLVRRIARERARHQYRTSR